MTEKYWCRCVGFTVDDTDPDLVALIDSADSNRDPYLFVDECTSCLLGKFECFDGSARTALDRIRAIAWLAGFEVRAMDRERSKREEHDAVLVPTQSDYRRGLILYNPWKTESRIVHSIAHEIAHSFFPNSRAGAQFRAIHRLGNGPVPGLEHLCDHGAAALTMPIADFRRAVAETGIQIKTVDRVRRRFGTSFEATFYRMATTAADAVAAALFCFRTPKRIGQRGQQLASMRQKTTRLSLNPSRCA